MSMIKHSIHSKKNNINIFEQLNLHQTVSRLAVAMYTYLASFFFFNTEVLDDFI